MADHDAAAGLAAELPPGLLLRDPEVMAPHLTDWRGWFRGSALGLARPRDVAEVQAVLRACRRHGVAVVPQGGNSSLCGGAVPAVGTGPAILLSLARMDRIRSLDPKGWSMVVEAGCTLAAAQQAAKDADRHLGLDFGARGTARIGGCIGTNAGGMSVLRYGSCRDQVLGIEAVLPDGRLWNGLRALRKDNSGYDLKHLFIGAEGTLGIVTAACLKLHPPERHGTTALLALHDVAAANAVADLALGMAAGRLSALELMPAMGIRRACAGLLSVPPPIALDAPWFVMLRLAAAEPVAALAEAIAAAALDAGLARDAVLSASAAQEARLWEIRDSFSALHRLLGVSHRFDLAVPLGRVPELAARASAALKRIAPGSIPFAFGHLGDGNLHFSACQPPGGDAAAFAALGPAIAEAVNAICWSLGGTVSAEHGIGQLHRQEMAAQKPPEEIAMMRAIKAALDPDGLMNPGQLLPP